ncbi:single-stranded-DNA-specific exonuclease RecJ [bacterium]|nr:single-stranded-DNA-specific exonuclease RecJ [bacterium]
MDVADDHAAPVVDTAPPPRKRWSVRSFDRDRANFLAKQLDVHPVVGTLLINRGVMTADEGVRFLDRKLKCLHDPAEHPGIVEAADRIYAAIQAKRSIAIYGDYDVDGMCASSILIECLRLAGVEPRSYIPDRFEEGYGVNSAALDRLKADGVDLVVTVDCGIASVAEADHARAIGLEYIVTDHHDMGETIPRADVVCHPRLPGSKYPFPHLCGTGVAFKLAWELSRRVSGTSTATPAFRKFLLDATTLAAIGTICDVVPIEGENRAIVHHGLMGLKQSPPLGLAYLIREAKLDSKKRFEADDVGFGLGPRLNACGRLGQATMGVELLTTRDGARAQDLAKFLDERNKERQTIERRTFLEARELAEQVYNISSGDLPNSIVLASESWHPGVIGIVASRMVERYHRPCILIAIDSDGGTGSGRSIRGVHLGQALSECSHHLVKAGGHEMAVGLRIHRHQIDSFREAFDAHVRSSITAEHLIADIKIDMEVPLHVLTPKLVRSLEVLEPFGVGNPKPLFLATNLTLEGEPRLMGGGNRHLAFNVRQGDKTMRAVAFGQGERVQHIADSQGQCSIVFEPMINDFRGYEQVELRVRDFCPGPVSG